MLSANDFSKRTTAGFTFGADAKATAARLRRLADDIESGQVLLQNVEIKGAASAEDFTNIVVTLTLHERVPAPPGDGG